jgi:hypothetical protein
MAPALKKQWHCQPDGEVKAVIYRGHEKLETKLDRCFGHFRSAETDCVWDAMNGAALFSCGLLEQPAVISSAIGYLEYCVQEAEHYGE